MSATWRCLLAFVFIATGCTSRQPTPLSPHLLAQGNFDAARERVRQAQIDDPKNDPKEKS